MAQIGDEGTEQFEIVTCVDGEEIKRQRIHDPFVHTVVVVGLPWWLHVLSIFRPRRIRVEVHLTGTHSAQTRIMTMDPAEMALENEAWLKDRAESRANSVAAGYSNCRVNF